MKVKSSVAALVCASLLVPLVQTQAIAAPMPKPAITNAESGVTLVHRRGRGPATGAAIIGGLIAGALIAGSIREGRAEERDIRRCERDFYSFDRRTGTYINRYGDERICPYLR
ncbi:hypothetical protein APY04_3324 [Hyphomicrobium sulfonivorans]|uniref:Uncharacterized protein n=1 Tax=Hyphomicrobium sulfonivorans TaxID=121290 RepID=A0A109B986_HYPSL|nr:BA14K family protein [Hyphomicrobium sulfonivorans]KWT64312.1 hypothetical protein APY04_3324 [Hyphomicrobium sulfonivorans]